MIRFLICLALLVPAAPRDPWFYELQREDGSWDADQFPESLEGAVPGGPDDDVAVTSLLVLACLADGNHSSRGIYSERVALALGWLAGQQTENGRIGRKDHGRVLHHHALATLVLSENVYFKGQPDYSAQVTKALELLAGSALKGGGWSASGDAEDPVDPVTTTWAAMALRSARDGKLTESTELIERAVKWFRERCDPESGLFRVSEDAQPDLKATVCALATRFFAGEKPREAPGFAVALDAIIEGRPTFLADPEYYFFASVVAFQVGGKHWKAWIKLLKRTVLDHEPRPAGPYPVEPDAPVCGSLGASALAFLCLEFVFRHGIIVGAR